MPSTKKLKSQLDKLVKKYDKSYLESDPLMFPHLYKSNRDREIVGLISAVLAYGQVKIIQKSIKKILKIMGENGKSPYDFTMNFLPSRDSKQFKGFKHRFNDGRDISLLIYYMRQMIEESGSIGAFFAEGYNKDHSNIKEALTSFTERTLNLDTDNLYNSNTNAGKKLPKNATVRFFFSSPAGGSTCKRLNLYLRWMVRSDSDLPKDKQIDFGLWKKIPPSKLVIPVDTHIARLAQNLGLTSRQTTNWKMAEEITGELKKLDSNDPIKYDFAICRLGILDECPKKKDPVKCEKCLIKEVCIL